MGKAYEHRPGLLRRDERPNDALQADPCYVGSCGDDVCHVYGIPHDVVDDAYHVRPCSYDGREEHLLDLVNDGQVEVVVPWNEGE